MKRRINGLYELSYKAYWFSKGFYGEERYARMRLRKASRKIARAKKKKEKAKYCSCCGRYLDDW